MKNIFIYNLEPWLALPDNESEQRKDIQYCQSNDDFANMGISCLSGVHIDLEAREIISTVAAPWNATTRSFLRRTASDPDILLGGFNCSKFEDVLLRHNGLSIQSEFDLLDITIALVAKAGDRERDLERDYTLDKIAVTNDFAPFHHKQVAPYLYQQNEIPLMLIEAQQAALAVAKVLLLLLDGNFIDPHTNCFLEYQFPTLIANLHYE